MNTVPAGKVNRTIKTKKDLVYSVEFFHIYTDETIGDTHRASLNYLREAKKAWGVEQDLIVLIDNYNPENHILSGEDVLLYLEAEGFVPDYFAFEGDMVANAQTLLDSLTSKKLKRSYDKYISSRNKYPCSLLTASWYLTRLGRLPNDSVIKSPTEKDYRVAQKLINILPLDYRDVEMRALELIANSAWQTEVNNIQDLFYPAGSHRKVDLF